MRDTERERRRHRQGEKQAPCGDPDAGLDPKTPGSCPGPKAAAEPLSPQADGHSPRKQTGLYAFQNQAGG